MSSLCLGSSGIEDLSADLPLDDVEYASRRGLSSATAPSQGAALGETLVEVEDASRRGLPSATTPSQGATLREADVCKEADACKEADKEADACKEAEDCAVITGDVEADA